MSFELNDIVIIKKARKRKGSLVEYYVGGSLDGHEGIIQGESLKHVGEYFVMIPNVGVFKIPKRYLRKRKVKK